MNSLTKKSTSLWGALTLLFLVFQAWHTGFDAPLTDPEKEHLAQKLKIQEPNRDPAIAHKIMEEDDGEPIYVVNMIKFHDVALPVEGEMIAKTGIDALEEYNRFVFGYLAKRGSYPVFVSRAITDSIDLWGIDNAEEWNAVVLVRYRSRRVLLEMAADPVFDKFHAHKFAGIEKTIALPTSAILSIVNLPLIFFMLLMTIGLSLQILLLTKKPKPSNK